MIKLRIIRYFMTVFLIITAISDSNGYPGNETIVTGLKLENLKDLVHASFHLTDFKFGVTQKGTGYTRFADKINKCVIYAFFNRENICFQIQLIYYSIPAEFSAENNHLFYDRLHHYLKNKYGIPQYADEADYFALAWFVKNTHLAVGLYFFKKVPRTPVSIIYTDRKLGKGIPVPARMVQ